MTCCLLLAEDREPWLFIFICMPTVPVHMRHAYKVAIDSSPAGNKDNVPTPPLYALDVLMDCYRAIERPLHPIMKSQRQPVYHFLPR